MATVAAVIIGDEILTGKVADANAPLLIALCRDTGATLGRLVYVGDDVAGIAAEVARCAAAYDVVLTSGGVGPTHDDCTVDGVARAFDVGVTREPEIERLIRTFWADRFTDAALRMADVPEGARLVYGSDGLLPLVAFRNVYLLPGIPELFASKLRTLRRELVGDRLATAQLYLRSDESRIATDLRRVDGEFPDVKIGSYPRLAEPSYRLWIVLEGADPARVDAALDRLLEALPAADIVRIERATPDAVDDGDRA